MVELVAYDARVRSSEIVSDWLDSRLLYSHSFGISVMLILDISACILLRWPQFYPCLQHRGSTLQLEFLVC